jgi:hypothetical protein
MTLAIHIDSSHLRIAHLHKGKIVSLRSLAMSEVAEVEAFVLSRSCRVASALSAADSIVRIVELPASAHRHRKQVIDFQTKSATHIPEGDLHSASLWQRTKDSVQLSLFLTRRDLLDSMLERFRGWGLALDQMTTLPRALWRYAQWKEPSFQDGWLIDARPEEWVCVQVARGQIAQARALSTNDRTADLERLIPQPGQLFCTGDPKEIARVVGLLQGPDVQDCAKSFAKEEKLFAIAIGIAMEDQPDGLQFLHGAWTPARYLQGLGQRALWIAGALLLTNGAALLIGEQILRTQEQAEFESVEQFLEAAPPFLTETIDPFREGWEARWATALDERPDAPVYFPLIPSAESVLRWLTEHPLWTLEPTLSLLSFHYSLLETPDPYTKTAPLRIELEFQTGHAQRARQFHDALANCEELHWDALSDRYRVSFVMRAL